MLHTGNKKEYSVLSEQYTSWKVSSSLRVVTGLCDFTLSHIIDREQHSFCQQDSSGCVLASFVSEGHFFIALKSLYPGRAGFFFFFF